MLVITQSVSGATITDWLRTIIPFRFENDAAQRDLRELLSEIDKLRYERNRLIHGQWAIGPEPKTAIVQTVNLARNEIVLSNLVTASDLDDLRDRIQHALNKLIIVREKLGFPTAFHAS